MNTQACANDDKAKSASVVSQGTHRTPPTVPVSEGCPPPSGNSTVSARTTSKRNLAAPPPLGAFLALPLGSAAVARGAQLTTLEQRNNHQECAKLIKAFRFILINDAIKVVLDVVFVPLVKYPLHVAKIFHRVFKILSMVSFWHANSPHRTTSWLAADMVNVARRPEMYACESGSRKNKNNPRGIAFSLVAT